MITLRADQLRVFSSRAQDDFAHRVEVHVTRCFPRHAANATEIASKAMRSGRAHGFETEKQLMKFVNLVCVLGPGFEEREGNAWARSALGSGGAAEARMAALQRGAERTLSGARP